MISEKDRTIDPQESADKKRDEQLEDSPENGNETPALEDEVEKEEYFDPDTADRESLLRKYRELVEQLKEVEERVLRTAADAENFKKRLQREKEEQTRYANEAFMRDLLPVIDNLKRALEHSEAGSSKASLIEGLNMTLKGFVDTMGRLGCNPVKAVGEIFDPNFHEAVSQEHSTKHEANTVLRELQKGYTLKERLLRPAMVVVSKRPNGEDSGTHEEATGEATEADTGEVKIKVRKA
ncbi:MAG: nucleotide exchange factor GrpE [Deltaproteobacteria bacterium]|nr:nucleotide exchange factor GrpE [Deltaproteobacteria bacterium]